MRLILAYHSLHAPGWSYGSNDHIALWHDLKACRQLGYTILPLEHFVNAILSQTLSRLPEKSLAITFDDGVDHDFVNFFHPEYGFLPSFHSIIADSIAAGYPASATSFVIAAPDARRELAERCITRDEWRDCWWAEAASSTYWDIANHSWDHNHSVLSRRALPDSEPGQFMTIDTWEQAETQIAKAQDYIMTKTKGNARRWFAYPYGHCSDFLADQYLPKSNSIEAAFTTDGKYLDDTVDPYRVPRFVCGQDWKTPDEFVGLLALGTSQFLDQTT